MLFLRRCAGSAVNVKLGYRRTIESSIVGQVSLEQMIRNFDGNWLHQNH